MHKIGQLAMRVFSYISFLVYTDLASASTPQLSSPIPPEIVGKFHDACVVQDVGLLSSI